MTNPTPACSPCRSDLLVTSFAENLPQSISSQSVSHISQAINSSLRTNHFMMRRDNSSSPRSSRPPRRRQAHGPRANRACVSCKEKKLKCDEMTPTCANCQRFDLVCLVEDPDTKKHRPRNYLKTLEERLAKLESCGSVETPNSTGSTTYAPNSSHESCKSVPVFTSDAGSIGGSDLSTRIGFLDVKTNQVEPQYLGSSSAFAFAHLINSSLRGAIIQYPSLERFSRIDPSPMPCLLPDHSIAITLSNAYFENIHPQYPFLHEPTFRHYEKTRWDPSVEAPDIHLYSVPLFFVNMVYAIGALLVPGYQHLSEQLYSSAQLYPEVLSLNNIEAIQAYLCFAMYSLRSAKGPSLWKLSGLALRECIELGYHRSTNRVGAQRDALQIELRKRAFWCAQGIDCTYALRLGRPLGIQVHEIDAELPLDIDDSCITRSGIRGTPRNSYDEAPTSMSNALHVIRLRRIWARIHTFVYSTHASGDIDDTIREVHIAQIRKDLEEWRENAPEPPPRSGNTFSIFSTRTWYDLNYSGTILHLYRTQLTEGRHTSGDIFLDCIQAASTVCRLYRRQYVGTSIKYTWGTLHCLFLAGLTYLHCLWTSPTACESAQQTDVSRTCTDCTMVLVVIAEGWEDAAPYRDIFEILASRTMSMIFSRHQPLPRTPALSDSSDREAVTRWMADIDDKGMLAGFDVLLSGFVDQFTPDEFLTTQNSSC